MSRRPLIPGYILPSELDQLSRWHHVQHGRYKALLVPRIALWNPSQEETILCRNGRCKRCNSMFDTAARCLLAMQTTLLCPVQGRGTHAFDQAQA